MHFQPQDMIVWLSQIDVNGLTATDADHLAAFDVNDDNDLKNMIYSWIKPQFEQHDAQNQAEMREILEQSKQWTAKQLQPVFMEIGIPSGQKVKNIDRFMEVLRGQILGVQAL
jgi:hypothetical protein